jgi:SAM-dependent methyltransferase
LCANEAERRRWNDERWASAWPNRERLTDQVTPFLLEALALQQGEAVLDVGCGGGMTSLAAARLVGTGGAVVGADLSRPILALARRRAADAVAANVSFVQADIQVDRVGNGLFDVVMSQLGVMFFDNPIAAFANICDHLRPGGRLGFACWQPSARNPWFSGPVLARFVPAAPDPPEGTSATGPFTLGEPERVVSILGTAGFTGISRAGHEVISVAPDDAVFDDAQMRMMGIPDSVVDEARHAVALHLSQFRQAGGLCRFPLAFWIFTARRD